ncbi:MAG: SCO1664 family protein [Chloroflexales bacterium]
MDEQQPRQMEASRVLDALAGGELSVEASMPYSSNATLLCTLNYAGMRMLGIYKPCRGERPLWDFPQGTLYRREVAAYLVSEALGFGLVPPTVLRDGPYGVGMVQLFIENDEESHLFTMLKVGGYDAVIRRLCAFDVLVNNADRKGGHAIKGLDGRLWAIDHGICFHFEPKLRTVLWDFVGEPLPADVPPALVGMRERLDANDVLAQTLAALLEKAELRALRRRLNALIDSGCFPAPGPGPNVPWPPV